MDPSAPGNDTVRAVETGQARPEGVAAGPRAADVAGSAGSAGRPFRGRLFRLVSSGAASRLQRAGRASRVRLPVSPVAGRAPTSAVLGSAGAPSVGAASPRVAVLGRSVRGLGPPPRRARRRRRRCGRSSPACGRGVVRRLAVAAALRRRGVASPTVVGVGFAGVSPRRSRRRLGRRRDRRVAAAGPRGRSPCPASRWATAANSRIEPATAAFSEPIAPRIGIRTATSPRRRTAGDEALALAADDDRERPAQVGLGGGQRRVGLGGGDPQARGSGGPTGRPAGRRPGTAGGARPRRPTP